MEQNGSRFYEVEIPGLPSISCDKKEGDDSDDGKLDIYEPRVRYNENDGIYAEVVIFVNQRLVRLMDVTVEQWLDLIGDDEVELTDEEFFNLDNENLIDKDEVAKIFRTKEYHRFLRNRGQKMKFPLMTSIIFGSLSVLRMAKLNGPHEIQMMKVSTIEENYQRWNDEEAIHEEREREREREREQNNEHSMGKFDYDLVWDNTPYHANKEKDQYKEYMCKMFRNAYQKSSDCKIRRFKVIK
nr:hypothetical protein [Tanacetum cinerariifolium]